MASPVTTYQRYKLDTNLFTTWLGRTAKACGWKPATKPDITPAPTPADPPKGPRLKGKARKAAKQAATQTSQDSSPIQKYVTTTEELLAQAEAVAKSQSPMMPNAIHKSLQSAINARQRCAAWFENTNASTPASLAGHRYFVGILERVLGQLGLMAPASQSTPSVDRVQKHEDEDLVFMRNAFEALEVEDIPEDETTEISKPIPASRAKESYELEVDQKMETAFIVFSLFEDIHRLRTELKQVWTQFRDGRIELLQATVLTTAALELVNQAEEEVYSTYSMANQASPHTYKDLTRLIYEADALEKGEVSDFLLEPTQIKLMKTEDLHTWADDLPNDDECDQISTKTLEIRPFDEFVLLPAGRTLLRLAQYKSIVEHTKWPYPMSTMRFNYISRPELLDDPRLQPFLEQDDFLLQVFLDMTLEDQVRHSDLIQEKVESIGFNPLTGYDDPFYATMRQLWTQGTVTTKMVFAAQVMWDIYAICRSCPSPIAIMKSAAAQTQDSFQFYTDPANSLDTKDVRWRAKDADLLMTLYRRITINLLQPPIIHLKQMMLERPSYPPIKVPSEMFRHANTHRDHAKHEKAAKQINAEKMVEPNKDLRFLLKANPLYAGTLLLDVAAMVEEAGVELANHHLSIFCVAHLYNALYSFGLLQVHWPEMEQVIELHRVAIFAAEIPTTAKEMVSRFIYRTGLSTSNSRRFNQKEPWKFQTTQATQALRGFFGSKGLLPRLMGSLRAQAEAHELKVYGRHAGRRVPLKVCTPTLTPRNTLVELGRYLEAMLPDIKLDYVSLTRRCSKFMRALRSRIHSSLGFEYPIFQTFPGDSNDHSLLVVILGILEEANLASSVPVKGKKKEGSGDKWQNAPQLLLARDMLLADLSGSGGSGLPVEPES